MPSQQLRFSDLGRLAHIGGLLVAFEVLKRGSSLPRLLRTFERAPRTSAVPAAEVERTVWLTQGVLRRCYRRDFCLPQSLVLFHLLSGWGLPVRIHFGVRKQDGAVAGHAWLDLDGEPFCEPHDPRLLYHTIHSHPSSAERYPYGRPTPCLTPRGLEPARRPASQTLRRAEARAAREAA